MLDQSALTKTDHGWQFATEKDLEDFVWQNIQELFGLTPFKRQYSAKGEYCDILAISENRQLTILELKNTEDRYIVQQLTRYYDNLLSERPLADQIDYEQTVQLIALKPCFHRHNEIDRKYHLLQFQFLLFDIVQEDKQLYFNLKNSDNTLIIRQLPIPYPQEYVDEDDIITLNVKTIPPLPKSLQTKLNERYQNDKSRILEIREKILMFDEQMGENNTPTDTCYGLKGRNGNIIDGFQCVEFWHKVVNIDDEKKSYFYWFYLWLPFPRKMLGIYSQSTDKKIARIKINSLDLQSVSTITINQNQKVRTSPPLIDHRVSAYSDWYSRLMGKQIQLNTVDDLIDIALEEWLKRKNEKLNGANRTNIDE